MVRETEQLRTLIGLTLTKRTTHGELNDASPRMMNENDFSLFINIFLHCSGEKKSGPLRDGVRTIFLEYFEKKKICFI